MTEEQGPARAGRTPGWLVAVLLVIAIGVGFGAGALVWAGDSAEPARSQKLPMNPPLSCVNVYFDPPDPDPAMRAAADQLRGDPRFETLQQQDQQRVYAEFKAIFADQPELVKLARKEAMPAAVRLRVRDGNSRTQVEDQLRDEFPEAKVVEGYCP